MSEERETYMRDITIALFCLATFNATSAPPAQPQHADLPAITPGEVTTMSIDALSPGATTYFNAQHDKSLKETNTSADGITFRLQTGSPQQVEMLNRFITRARPALDEKKALSAVPVVLPSVFTSKAENLGVIQERGTSGSFTRISRLYRLEDKTIMLTEWDYLTDGGGVVQFTEFVNTTINGKPAVLSVTTSDSGALWNIAWTTAAKDYVLYVHEPTLSDHTAAFVRDFAAAIKD